MFPYIAPLPQSKSPHVTLITGLKYVQNVGKSLKSQTEQRGVGGPLLIRRNTKYAIFSWFHS